MIHVRCRCGRQLQVIESFVGKAGACPACKGTLQLAASGLAPGQDDFEYALIIERGPERVGEQIFLGGTGPIEIGKLKTRNIILGDPSVSRAHCRLVRTNSGWRVEDQGSRNGVFVNNARVNDRELRDGDRIRIGHYVFRYADAARPAAVDGQAHSSAKALSDDELYPLAATEEDVTTVPPPTAVPFKPPDEVNTGPSPVCPCCRQELAYGAKICVECGVDLKTGRAVLTAYDADLDRVYDVTEGVIRVLSWIIPAGIYPVASEALGTRKPYVARGLAVLTVLISSWFWVFDWSGSPQMRSYKNLMLWSGTAPPTAEMIYAYYQHTPYGDRAAFESELEERRAAAARAAMGRGTGPTTAQAARARVRIGPSPQITLIPVDDERIILDAYNALTPSQQCLGRYRPSQLITHAFLHDGILHLAGNLLFLLVFGSRVNALIGNVATLGLYPVLAAAAGLAHAHAMRGMPPHPMVGASGAIMGLAGMYLVLLSLHNVHMAAWFRWGLLRGFHLSLTLFPVRGFWVVLFYIAFDVFYTAVGIQDNTAHWAHLGGFLAGVGVGLVLLLSRLVNCRGGDILSGIFGRHAWALVGRPNRRTRGLP